jgi:hypothetical protein
MNPGARPRPLRSSGRLRRLAARRPAVTLLLALAIVVVALTLVVAGLPAGAGIVRAAGIMLALLSPTLLGASAMFGASAVRAVRDRLADWRDSGIPQPDGPPIEKLAADLRRLLWHHDEVITQSNDGAMSTLRLRALQAAITICATQAARALEVPYPDPPTDAGLDAPQLGRLLRALADAGLVLPPAVRLLAPDGRR